MTGVTSSCFGARYNPSKLHADRLWRARFRDNLSCESKLSGPIMDVRDAIALPATLVFVALGFYGIVRSRLRMWRRRAAERGRATGGEWQQLSARSKLLRRCAGIAVGIVLAVMLQAIGTLIMDTLSR